MIAIASGSSRSLVWTVVAFRRIGRTPVMQRMLTFAGAHRTGDNDPLLSFASTSWVSAMAVKAAGASGRFRRARVTRIECRAAVVHVDRHSTHS